MTNHWTTTPPTKPGDYWWKYDDNSRRTYVALDGNGYLETGLMPHEVGGVWCGPLVPEPVGIVGKLVEAGTLEGMDGFHGLLIEVPVEDLRKAESVPLYRKVMVVEVNHE